MRVRANQKGSNYAARGSNLVFQVTEIARPTRKQQNEYVSVLRGEGTKGGLDRGGSIRRKGGCQEVRGEHKASTEFRSKKHAQPREMN